MKDCNFCTQDASKPYYYVFVKGDAPVGQRESCFYRYDTAREASALFNYLQAEHPDWNISLGIHKDLARRADIIERTEGVSALSDDYRRTEPWKNEPSLDAVANELAKRLGATWKTDRELVGRPVLVPNEPKSRFLPEYFEGKTLCPDVPGNPRTSIREVFVQTLGWMPLDGLKSVASHHGHGNPEIPAVSHYLVTYRVDENGFRGTASISPADFETMQERYLARQQCREQESHTVQQQPQERQPKNAPQAEILRGRPTAKPDFHDTIKQAKERAYAQNAAREPKHHTEQKEPVR